MALDAVLAEARAAKAAGATRFCMGAAWREPKDRDLDQVCAMVEGVKALGLETCVTLGMLTATQAQRLKAGRPRRLQPQPRHLAGVLRRDHHHAHLSGPARHARPRARGRHHGVLRRHRRHGRERGGPRRHDRDARRACRCIRNPCRSTCWCRSRARRSRRGAALDPLDFVRTIAVARITMPQSMVRLSAGREDMSDETQALCFLAGANSIFYGRSCSPRPIRRADRDRR